MKRLLTQRRAAGLLTVAFLLGAVGCSKPDVRDLDGRLLIQALQAYHEDAVSRGEALPEKIPTVALLERGLLTINDLRALEGYYIDIPSTNFPLSDVAPDTVIIFAHNDAGGVVQVRANGSLFLGTSSGSP